MSAAFQSGGGNTTVTFTYTATTSKMQATIFGAAEYIWDSIQHNAGAFSALTTQQKLDIVDAYVKSDIIDKAQRRHIQEAEETAQEQATGEAETYFELT